MALDGTWCYRLKSKKKLTSKTAIRLFHERHLNHVAYRGYKIAIKIKIGQTVELSFLGTKGWFAMQPSAAVAADAENALPAGPGEQWVGFEPPPGTKRKPTFPEPGCVCYRYKLVVSPVPNPPQVVPLIVTYTDVPFATHYLMDARILVSRPDKGLTHLTTTVSAMR
ncbi:MAG TPA: hypothetical protein VMI34_24590 [Candidatus Bathyarchaeia archaeon]|nr:hypothetical protein [Candidatus Bathyarchaeia archaeon]